MKLSVLHRCIPILTLLFEPCRSLPFARSKKNEGEEKSKTETDYEGTNVEIVSSNVRGAASKLSEKLSTQTSETIPIIQSFFQATPENSDSSSDVSLALKEVISKLSNTEDMKDFLQATRRNLHRNPELMYELPFTSNTIQKILKELEISFTTGWAKNTHPEAFPGTGGFGIVAHIGTMNPDQPCIILRADMDALPILEATKGINSFKSSSTGKMHACGHDGHVTMLLGAAALLKKVESQLEGTVRLVFQPAEEGGAGMKRMVEEGIVHLEPKAQYGFGMHVWPTLATGVISARAGPLMAAAESFEIVIEGKGGHAAMPHLTKDPIVASSILITNLQTIVSRTLSPLESGVVSITQMTAGNSFNVIPASATIRGTVRALSTDMLLSLREKVQQMMKATAEMYGCNSTIEFSPDYYPPTVNDEDLFDWSRQVGALVSREGMLRDTAPTMGAEDFSFLAQAVPSTFFFIGQGSGGDETYHIPRTDYGLHHPSFALDEDVMPIGVELHANLALRALKKLSQDSEAMTRAEL